VPVTATLKNETPSDGQASQQQGKDQGDFRHLAVTPGASAAETSSSAAVTADKPATPARPLSEQIAVHMARGARNGLSHLHIALEPDSLGRLEIRLDFQRDGRLSAAIVADRPETLNLLRSEAQSLQDQLNAAGFKADSDTLSFDLGSSHDRPPVAEMQTRRSSLRFGENDETGDDAPTATSLWRPVSSGRLDIRA
jgi:flagellar hook-length control protein FliK